MSDKEAQFVAYACFEMESESDEVRVIGISADKDMISKWKRERRPRNEPKNTESCEAKSQIDQNAELSNNKDTDQKYSCIDGKNFSTLMESIASSISSYRHLIFFSHMVVPMMKQHFTNKNLYARASQELYLVDRDNNFLTYGVTRDQYLWLDNQIQHLRE
jgi:hypothetical protein